MWLHALSCPCCDMPCRANVEACRAHVVACMPCRTHVVACIVPMSWHVKPCGCMPCHVSCDCPVTSTSRAMAWPLQPHPFSFMHLSRSLCRGRHVIFRAIALCPYRGMPFAHVVACLFKHGGISPCLFKPMSWHALSGILPSVLSISWHGLSSPFHDMPCVAR